MKESEEGEHINYLDRERRKGIKKNKSSDSKHRRKKERSKNKRY